MDNDDLVTACETIARLNREAAEAKEEIELAKKIHSEYRILKQAKDADSTVIQVALEADNKLIAARETIAKLQAQLDTINQSDKAWLEGGENELTRGDLLGIMAGQRDTIALEEAKAECAALTELANRLIEDVDTLEFYYNSKEEYSRWLDMQHTGMANGPVVIKPGIGTEFLAKLTTAAARITELEREIDRLKLHVWHLNEADDPTQMDLIETAKRASAKIQAHDFKRIAAALGLPASDRTKAEAPMSDEPKPPVREILERSVVQDRCPKCNGELDPKNKERHR